MYETKRNGKDVIDMNEGDLILGSGVAAYMQVYETIGLITNKMAKV